MPAPAAGNSTPLGTTDVCQEAGARVPRNVRLADMNLLTPVHDARRIEIPLQRLDIVAWGPSCDAAAMAGDRGSGLSTVVSGRVSAGC